MHISGSPIQRIVVKAILVLIVAFLGCVTFAFTAAWFNSVDYTTNTYIGILTNELIFASKPALIGIIPAFLIIMRIVFSSLSWVRTIAIVVVVGVVLIAIPYTYTINRWQPLLSITNGLLINEITYQRRTTTWSSSAGMRITFTIPDGSFKETDQAIRTRLGTAQEGLFHFRLGGHEHTTAYYSVYKETPDGRHLSPEHYDITQYDGTIEAGIHTIPVYEEYSY